MPWAAQEKGLADEIGAVGFRKSPKQKQGTVHAEGRAGKPGAGTGQWPVCPACRTRPGEGSCPGRTQEGVGKGSHGQGGARAQNTGAPGMRVGAHHFVLMQHQPVVVGHQAEAVPPLLAVLLVLEEVPREDDALVQRHLWQ